MEPIDQYRLRPGGDSANFVEPAARLLPASFDRMFTWEQAVCVLRKRGRFILFFAGTLIVGVMAVAFLWKNEYQPTARIEIDPLDSGLKTLQEIEYSNGIPDQDYLETQAQIIQGNALAISVIRALHLDKNAEFVTSHDLARFGQEQSHTTKYASARASSSFLQEQFDLADRTQLESISLGVFRQRLSVTPIRNSRLIEVSFSSHDPELARLITNTLVTQFMEQNYKNRFTSTMEASEWLSTQLNDLHQRVEESSQAVADYEKRYGLVEAADRDVPMSQLMAEMNHQLSDAQANRIEAEAYVRMVDFGQADALPALRDDQFYQNLMTRYADARAQLAQARTIYGDENANVKKLESESSELAAQVEAEQARVVSRNRNIFAAARAREQMMLKSREKLRAQMGAASSRLMQYQLLKNEAIANAELYNTLRGRLNEAGIYAGLRSSNIHVVELAPKLISATGPHRRFIITIGVFASGLFAVVLAFALESFDNTIRTPDDIKEWIGLPSLAMLPRIGRGGRGPGNTWELGLGESPGVSSPSTRILSSRAPLAESEAIRDLRTSLLLTRTDTPPQVVLVSSSLMGEGKTTVAVNLATAFAQRGRTCLLMDADLRRPRVAEAFGLSPVLGLSDVLNGTAAVENVLLSAPQVPGVTLLPSGRVESDPTDLLNTDRMRALVDTVKQKYDFVVIDSPPVIPFSDARLLALVSDVVILIGRYGFTTRRAITRGAQILSGVRAPVVGVVLNDIDVTSADFHYYNYGFSRGISERLFDSYSGYATQAPVASGLAVEGQEKSAEARPERSDSKDKSKGAHA